MYNLICILGHTAGGKTSIATQLAYQINGEIISADSRQVYKQMDIGTGKDLREYIVNGKQIPYHIIDIVPPGSKYNIYEYSKDFQKAYDIVISRGSTPIMCGGSGLYIESVLKNYNLIKVPPNNTLRKQLEGKSLEELGNILSNYKTLHNTSDTDTIKRAIRAIEISEYYRYNTKKSAESSSLNYFVAGIFYDRDTRRKRITARLEQRLNEGMIEEAQNLHKNGISYQTMEYYGLEYKYMAWYLSGKINRNEMFEKLNTAIHQFAKRQMTWFRKMERNGTKIHWIDGSLSFDEKLATIIDKIKKSV